MVPVLPSAGMPAAPSGRRPSLPVSQRDLVGLGDVAGPDGSQSLAQALTGLTQELQGIGRGTLRSRAVRISLVLLNEVGLERRSDFVRGL